ncbi:methyl-accepting chemotaxis protein [Stutzerimonas kirkiae]|uniref:Chemotaxis protein n=1 Tax=Stutzerimonas kirkiae TaxID=2211392 RepID=A0A4Q9QWF6_9GAMM|nr:methyl-accepting chemotaxis protein [Stutzerimonas kirkiae]TBU88514.1 chemotaxis protein [Stutzerimonas kirkiae]TBU99511.1 chemotaxis protein [Stutzerimonas kirkiae]TBV10424.1 chemotaxis protein [Stutzerimonas kirkiae]
MRLKSLTTLNTLLLLAVCLALAATLWWSERALERPYLLMSRYLGLSQQFQHGVSDNIQAYLSQGDAVRHSQAMKALEELDSDMDDLPEQLAGQLRPSLVELHNFTAGDLLAAGKLAGDPQGLLLQAERELAAALEQLARYAGEGNGDAYLAPLFSASQHLLRLSHARGQFISSGRDTLYLEIEQALQTLKAETEKIERLPLLGLSEERKSDPFADLLGLQNDTDEQAAPDRGIALKRELASLLARYPAELQRTRELIRQRGELLQASGQRIEALQQALTALEPAVRAEHARIQSEVRLIQASIIALILLIALAIDRLQRRLTRAMERLAPTLGTWAEGNFGRPVSIDSNTIELKDIEASVNRLRDYLLQLVGTLREQARDVADSSHRLSETSSALHQGASLQSADTALIRDSLGELEATIQQVTEGTAEAAQASRTAGSAIAQGQQVIGQSLQGLHALVNEVQANALAIEHLANETSTIGNVLNVIGSIAEQTNLLALNAAIEAARAGSHGRGFAVVADEVRSLAQRTSGATGEIQQLIDTLQQAARQSVQAMRSQVSHAQATAQLAESAEGALDEIVVSIDTIGNMSERIAHTTAKQHEAVSEIRRHSERIHLQGASSLEHIDDNRQQSEQLLKLGRELDKATQAFCL